MRLIDADALLEELKERRYDQESPSLILTPAGQEIYNSGIDAAWCAVTGSETIDAVPVIRCKDCLYGTPTYGKNYIRCAIWGEDIKNDKYCYCGKRRTVKRND